MATKTLGTNLTTTLTAIQWTPNFSAADMATIQQGIKDDIIASGGSVTWPGAFSNQGLLYVPNRGILQLLPNDWVAFDGKGWPVVVPNAIIGTSWTHS